MPIGDVLTVSNALIWPAASIPVPGHYCFVGVAGNALDPKPDPTDFASFNQYVTYVENNNNVAWRNFNVVAGPPSPRGYRLAFIVPGAFDTSRRFGLEAIGRLPADSRAQLEVPAWFADALRPHPCEVEHIGGMVRIPLHPFGLQKLGEALLHAGSKADCSLIITIPTKAEKGARDFAIRQLYDGKEVGRVTWHFTLTEQNRRSPAAANA